MRPAVELFKNIPKIRRILQTLCDVGLDYLTLGQAAPTLSGGEAQRVKLAAELSRPDTGRTLYLLDEPTTGLHFDDLAKLLDVLGRLVDLGNTVVVIEHNLDVVKTADWVIDLGPRRGTPAGKLWRAARPRRWSNKRGRMPRGKAPMDRLAANKPRAPAGRSYTGEMLAEVLAAGPHREAQALRHRGARGRGKGDLDINEVGREVQMPWETNGRRWHTHDRVGRNGEPCHWDGRILERVVDRIQEQGDFSPTDWNNRTIVEICSKRKTDGWFFHAVTGHSWLLQLKFRVAKKTFRREQLLGELDLKPLNEMPDIPVYGSEPRVKCKQFAGPGRKCKCNCTPGTEIDRPVFWQFIEAAVAVLTNSPPASSKTPKS